MATEEENYQARLAAENSIYMAAFRKMVSHAVYLERKLAKKNKSAEDLDIEDKYIALSSEYRERVKMLQCEVETYDSMLADKIRECLDMNQLVESGTSEILELKEMFRWLVRWCEKLCDALNCKDCPFGEDRKSCNYCDAWDFGAQQAA